MGEKEGEGRRGIGRWEMGSRRMGEEQGWEWKGERGEQ